MVRITSKECLVILGREIHVIVRQGFSSSDPRVPVKGKYDCQTVLRKERPTKEEAAEQPKCKLLLSVKITLLVTTKTYL